MAIVKTLSKGQIVIPAEIRKKYHIKPGTKIQVLEYSGIIYLIPPVADPINAACGVLPSEPSLSEKLISERKGEFK
jgi:AbrB family looped-hinge helix DNA binding protein